MSLHHAVVWIDYDEACIGRFDRECASMEIVKLYSSKPKAGNATRSLRAPETARHFNDIAATVRDAQGILIVGPGFERLELLVHLRRHFPRVADTVVALETVGQPSGEAMLPIARKHFIENTAAA